MKSGVMPGGNAPAFNAVALTKSNSTPLVSPSRFLWVGGAGDVAVIMEGDNTQSVAVVFAAVPAGTLLPVRATYLRSTGTSATAVIAMF